MYDLETKYLTMLAAGEHVFGEMDDAFLLIDMKKRGLIEWTDQPLINSMQCFIPAKITDAGLAALSAKSST